MTALDDVKKSFSIAEVEHFESGKFLPEFAAAFLDERLIDRYDQIRDLDKCPRKKKHNCAKMAAIRYLKMNGLHKNGL